MRSACPTQIKIIVTSKHDFFRHSQILIPVSEVERTYTESTRHESTKMSHETHRLSVRGNMDTPMRERRICD